MVARPEEAETWAEKSGTESSGKVSKCATTNRRNAGWCWEKLRAGVAGTGCEPGAGRAQQLICLQSQPAHLGADADDAPTVATLCVHTSPRLNNMANTTLTLKV